MSTPIETLLAVVTHGGTLDPVGDKLRVRLPENSAAALRAAIRTHKPALQALIAGKDVDWSLVRSEALGGALVFFAQDEAVKAGLVRQGAHPEAVYTRTELAELVRVGAEPGQLLALHLARQVFGGRVVTPADLQREA